MLDICNIGCPLIFSLNPQTLISPLSYELGALAYELRVSPGFWLSPNYSVYSSRIHPLLKSNI